MDIWNRPWWPSGLSRRSNSSRVAAEDPGSNPAWGCLYGKDCFGNYGPAISNLSCCPVTVHSGSQKNWKEEPNWQSPQTNLDSSTKSKPTLELISRTAPSVEAHHQSVGPDAGINSEGRQIKKMTIWTMYIIMCPLFKSYKMRISNLHKNVTKQCLYYLSQSVWPNDWLDNKPE